MEGRKQRGPIRRGKKAEGVERAEARGRRGSTRGEMVCRGESVATGIGERVSLQFLSELVLFAG